MANKTIYPYGSGGQLPSNIGIVNDLTTGGADKALSAEQGKILAQYAFLGSGTFADAYDKAKTTIAYFPWLLEDTDKDGNAVKKMIWHVGNKKFIDAIGAEISGQKNGLTVTVTKDCDMVVNGTTYALSKGDNNFSMEDLSISENGSINNEILFYDTGTTTSTKSSVTAIDFGNIPFKVTSTGANTMGGFTNLTKIERLVLSNSTWFYSVFGGNKVKEIKATGTIISDIYGLFNDCTLLEKADFSGLAFRQNGTAGQLATLLYKCPLLKEVDVRLLDLSKTKTPYRILGESPIKKLTIGENFTNTGFTNKGELLSGVTGATLIIVSSTPPKLKNCSFTDEVANDEHSTTYDWLSYTSNGEEIRRFDAIYVPDDAVDAYKTDVYVENGTVGNTGWSYYADIIKPMIEYVE